MNPKATAITMKYSAIMGNPASLMEATASKAPETLKTGAPPETMRAMPRTAVMVPRVMMKEGIAP